MWIKSFCSGNAFVFIGVNWTINPATPYRAVKKAAGDIEMPNAIPRSRVSATKTKASIALFSTCEIASPTGKKSSVHQIGKACLNHLIAFSVQSSQTVLSLTAQNWFVNKAIDVMLPLPVLHNQSEKGDCWRSNINV
jgi:hypothetical protein